MHTQLVLASFFFALALSDPVVHTRCFVPVAGMLQASMEDCKKVTDAFVKSDWSHGKPIVYYWQSNVPETECQIARPLPRQPNHPSMRLPCHTSLPGSCMLRLDIVTGASERTFDFFPMKDLINAASSVIKDCVAVPWLHGVGGYHPAGQNSWVNVGVMGKADGVAAMNETNDFSLIPSSLAPADMEGAALSNETAQSGDTTTLSTPLSQGDELLANSDALTSESSKRELRERRSKGRRIYLVEE